MSASFLAETAGSSASVFKVSPLFLRQAMAISRFVSLSPVAEVCKVLSDLTTLVFKPVFSSLLSAMALVPDRMDLSTVPYTCSALPSFVKEDLVYSKTDRDNVAPTGLSVVCTEILSGRPDRIL